LRTKEPEQGEVWSRGQRWKLTGGRLVRTVKAIVANACVLGSKRKVVSDVLHIVASVATRIKWVADARSVVKTRYATDEEPQSTVEHLLAPNNGVALSLLLVGGSKRKRGWIEGPLWLVEGAKAQEESGTKGQTVINIAAAQRTEKLRSAVRPTPIVSGEIARMGVERLASENPLLEAHSLVDISGGRAAGQRSYLRGRALPVSMDRVREYKGQVRGARIPK